jgi:Fusaric acid resistance protein-like
MFPVPISKYKEIPPKPSSTPGAVKYRIWKNLEMLKKPEIKFAVKVGVGAVILALPAFTQRWREFYTHWRGEWALLSYFVVIASSVGATTSTGLWR